MTTGASRVVWSQRELAALLLYMGIASCADIARAQEPPAPQAIAQAALQSAIDRLGALDYETRTTASRTIRRTPGAQAVPALLRAVAEHTDGYVRYRALVLLTGFNDPRTPEVMRDALSSPNDRLRGAAYGFFEDQPDARLTEQLLGGLESEHSEFVRPALIRALAALAETDVVRQALVREVGRGEDFFRGVVIEALGDYRAAYAFDALNGIATRDGPLVDAAAVALGKVGDRRALDTLGGLQQTVPRASQPSVAAGMCLLGVNCEVHERYVIESLKFTAQTPGHQDALRRAASSLGALGVGGRLSAVEALFDIGIPARDPVRAPVSLAIATVALRNTPVFLSFFGPRAPAREAVALLAEGFEMLEEDMDKERFFAQIRRAYWESGGASPQRELMRTLIGQLDF